eukprot:scaffold95007_cov33-Tisochrysis_lutea.AAC.2
MAAQEVGRKSSHVTAWRLGTHTSQHAKLSPSKPSHFTFVHTNVSRTAYAVRGFVIMAYRRRRRERRGRQVKAVMCRPPSPSVRPLRSTTSAARMTHHTPVDSHCTSPPLHWPLTALAHQPLPIPSGAS